MSSVAGYGRTENWTLKKPRKPTAIDLFCGGGGLTVGLKAAGFGVVASVEIDREALKTYQANHPEVVTFPKDIREVTPSELIHASADGQIDLIAGCPPCQGFSSLTNKYHREDPRNDLILEFARIAVAIRPRCIMMENVPGIAKKGSKYLEKAVAVFEAAGYVVSQAVLDVADYGVPQRRKRFVLLAGLGLQIPIPQKEYSEKPNESAKVWKTVRDALGEMRGDVITFSAALAAGGPKEHSWHVVRDISETNRKRLHALPIGGSRKDLPDELRPNCHKGVDEGFGNVYGRMRWDEPSPTITSGCTTLSKGRFGHPEHVRTISVREAALLQTFPLTYSFDTDQMDKACQIIGNALPCTFAEKLSQHCLTYLQR